MTMSNIKAGFRKSGICPFNPNAIDKSLLLRNKMIPNSNIDLAEPPTGSTSDTATQTTDDIHTIEDNPQEEPGSSVNSIVLTRSDSVGSASTSSVSITINEQEFNEGHSSSHNINPQSPNSNPLFTCGILSDETSHILFPPAEEIPQGRKRPLRIQSKARVMTAEDVQQDIARQQTDINAKAMKCKKTDVPKGKGKGKGKGSAAKDKKETRLSETGENVGLMEDQTCNGCDRDWDEEREELQSKWVGCETHGCPHWTCPRCLPLGFDYKDEYYCDDCVL